MSDDYDYTQDEVLEEDDMMEVFAHLTVEEKKDDTASDDPFAVVEGDGPAQFGNIKPWLGALHAPSNAPKVDTSAPTENLAVEWVHGYNCQGAANHSNVYTNTEGHLVYPAAAMVVVYDPAKHTQQFYMGMNDTVTCLAQSPANPNYFAAGQVATLTNGKREKPHICVFDSTAMNKQKVIPNAADRSILAVSFSPDGKFLAAIGGDDNHTMTIWDWRTATKVAESKVDGAVIFDVAWNHAEETSLVTVGVKHIFFWSFDGKTLKKTKAQMEGKGAMQTFLSVRHSAKGFACCGALDGSLYIFSLNCKLVKMLPNLHEKEAGGRLFTVIRSEDGGLITGGNDHRVCVVTSKMQTAATFTFSHAVKSVALSPEGKDLYVGLDNASIHVVKDYATQEGFVGSPGSALLNGHFDGELWGLALSADGQMAFTAGEDNCVNIWDIAARKLVDRHPISTAKGPMLKVRKACTDSLHPPNQCGRAIDIHPAKQQYVVGCNDGSIVVFTNNNGKLTAQSIDLNAHGKRNVKDQKENWIQAIRFSPDGSLLAVGTHGIVTLVLETNTFTVVGKGTANNAAITHLDWAADSSALKVVDRAYEMLFYNVDPHGKLVHNSNSSLFRDTEYGTETCPFGWNVRGIFDGLQTGCDVKGVDKSPAGNLVATGDNYQKVNLYRCPNQGFLDDKSNVSQKKAFGGHGSHVTTVKFTADQSRVLSTGGGDKCVIQWSVC